MARIKKKDDDKKDKVPHLRHRLVVEAVGGLGVGVVADGHDDGGEGQHQGGRRHHGGTREREGRRQQTRKLRNVTKHYSVVSTK